MRGCFPRKAKDYGDTEPELPAGIHTGLVRYTLQQLRIATNNFSSANKIGGGRFGSLLQGEINNRAVAVKRFVPGNNRLSDADFIGKINALCRIHHRNIISLIGFCISKDEQLLLVFDYADNGSLAYRLHKYGTPERLDWRTRRKIALGTARALAYLHHDCEPRILHGDIQPANILLDSKFEAKVSGYDDAILYSDSPYPFTDHSLHGLGYAGPEYLSSGSLTSKADVYSFGTIILEMITGLRTNILGVRERRRKVVEALKENMFEDIVDPRLPRDYNPKEITCMVACAVVSTFDSPTDRPAMNQIINVLEGHQTPDSSIRQVLEIEENSPTSYLDSPPPKSLKYPSSDEDTEDMKSLPLSSYINPLPSSSAGDLVGIGEDIKSLPLSSDMNLLASSSYIHPLPSSSKGDLVPTGEDIKSLFLSSYMNPPASSSSSYIYPLTSSAEGDLVATGEGIKSLPLPSNMNLPASSSHIYPLPSIDRILEMKTQQVVDYPPPSYPDSPPPSYPDSPPPKSFTYPSSDEDTEDMKSLPLSSDMNPPASSSYMNPLPSSATGDLVGIGKDMKSLPLSSDMNPPTLSSAEDIAVRFMKYTLQQLETATNNFSKHNVIGKGGFATVYKGNLENGLVAIKKLIAADERRDENFKIEINAISRVSHVNIISLVGYCIDGSSRLLIYELAPNGSLADHLRPERRSNLDWETRKKIMLGTAKALGYLHGNCKPRIVHRDIKPANVLLSSKFEAKLADLGIAKLQSTSFASQQLSSNIKGTYGYIDPYYYFSSIFTPKSDVYSFGILLLVSVTGFTPSQELEEAKGKLEKTLRNKNYNDLADKCLNNVYDRDDMQRMIACAAVSTLPSPDDRPTMREIIHVMQGIKPPSDFISKVIGNGKKKSRNFPMLWKTQK